VLIEKLQKQAAPEMVAVVKRSPSMQAAAVARRPAEEPVAAATAGKDELKPQSQSGAAGRTLSSAAGIAQPPQGGEKLAKLHP
jgi:hypothetical protein